MALPSITQNYYNFCYKHLPDNSRNASLWQVQEYYEISKDTIPSSIKPILENLPKRPLTSCELKKSRDSNDCNEGGNYE